MQGDNMKEKDVDKYLSQYLSGDSPREAFKQQTLRDSTAALVRVRQRRSVRRRAEFAAAAILIVGIGFLGGRMSMPPTLPRSVDVVEQATAEAGGVTVPSDLVAWLDAARLFRQLGMEDRMARAVERAGKLLPYDAVAVSSVMGQAFTATCDGIVEEQSKQVSPAGMLRPHESVESISGIMAQSFGDYNYESKMD
ncbi:MAG TPA: hypothetical protein DIU00_12385 [Phycisphaerales bacterium]|nr:hypothetical protein [Phycisphaerales bacterium]